MSGQNLLGAYGEGLGLPPTNGGLDHSYLNSRWGNVDKWRGAAQRLVTALLLAPTIPHPEVELLSRHRKAELEIEELAWSTGFGPPVRALFIRPTKATGPLPGVLALHDHGGDKYFGKSKIADGPGGPHPTLERHRERYYGGLAWANELARRGYGVLVHDVFPFESRRILAADLPAFVVERMMRAPGMTRELLPGDASRPSFSTNYDVSPKEESVEVDAYNAFAAQHESIIAKSLFSLGLTWPGVVYAEDRTALDYLASRPDIDPGRLGCCGLSGGGLRANYLAGLDSRIRCSVTVGFMTTWRDFALRGAFTHTWMIYVPGLAGHMDFPEILSMRAPLPTLVIAASEDPLFDREEAEKAQTILDACFRKAGAEENFRMSWYQGAHRFNREMQAEAFTWFDHRL